MFYRTVFSEANHSNLAQMIQESSYSLQLELNFYLDITQYYFWLW